MPYSNIPLQRKIPAEIDRPKSEVLPYVYLCITHTQYPLYKYRRLLFLLLRFSIFSNSSIFSNPSTPSDPLHPPNYPNFSTFFLAFPHPTIFSNLHLSTYFLPTTTISITANTISIRHPRYFQCFTFSPIQVLLPSSLLLCPKNIIFFG